MLVVLHGFGNLVNFISNKNQRGLITILLSHIIDFLVKVFMSFSLFALHMCLVVPVCMCVCMCVSVHMQIRYFYTKVTIRNPISVVLPHCCKTCPNESRPVIQETSCLIGSLIPLHPTGS